MWNFANSVCVFLSVWCVYIVGIEFLFSFCSRQQDEGKRNRGAQPNPPGRCFPTVVNFFLCISMWCGFLLRCWMLMYCRSWGSAWNVSYVVLFLWLELYVVVCISVVWLWVCWLIHATLSLSFFCRSQDPVEISRWVVLIVNSYARFCVLYCIRTYVTSLCFLGFFCSQDDEDGGRPPQGS